MSTGRLARAAAEHRDGRHGEAYRLLRALQRSPAIALDPAALALWRGLLAVGTARRLRDHRCLQVLTAKDRGPVVILRFLRGATALSGTTRGALQLWQLGNGGPIGELVGHRGRITSVATAAAAPVVVSVEERRHLRVWQLEDRSCRVHLDHSEHDDELFRLMTVSDDGRRGFSTDGASHGYLWNLETGRLMRHFDLVTLGVPARAFFAAGQDGVVLLEHHNGSWARLDMATDHLEAATAPAAAAEPDHLPVVVDERVILRQRSTGEDLLVLDGHGDSVLSATLAPGALMILSGDAGGEIRLWQLDWDLDLPGG